MRSFYLTLISCFLFLSCESDGYTKKSSALTADYKVQLLDDDTHKFELNFSNEEGIFGFIKSKEVYEKIVHLHKDGTIEIVLDIKEFGFDTYGRPPVLTSIKHTSSETLASQKLYLLNDNRIYLYNENDKSLELYREFDTQNNAVINFSHVPYTDYFIFYDERNYSIGYFSSLSKLSPLEYIESTIRKASVIWAPDEHPVFLKNRMYILGRFDDKKTVTPMNYSKDAKTPSFEFETPLMSTDKYNFYLQIDSNGNLYAMNSILRFVELDIKNQITNPVFINDIKSLSYEIKFKDSSETDKLDIFESTYVGYENYSIDNYMVLDKDLYIIKNKDLIKISDFKKQLKNTNPM